MRGDARRCEAMRGVVDACVRVRVRVCVRVRVRVCPDPKP